MPDAYRLEILTPAWQDIDRISDLHLLLVGAQSAQKITDKLLDAIALLASQPYMGALHPDSFLAQREYRKIIRGNYVCVYKVIGTTVYVYRIVDGRTDYPKLLR